MILLMSYMLISVRMMVNGNIIGTKSNTFNYVLSKFRGIPHSSITICIKFNSDKRSLCSLLGMNMTLIIERVTRSLLAQGYTVVGFFEMYTTTHLIQLRRFFIWISLFNMWLSYGPNEDKEDPHNAAWTFFRHPSISSTA